MKLLKIPSPVSLVELAQIAPEMIGSRQIVPMQLFQYHGRAAVSDNRIFVISGFHGPSKNDVHISGLLQKALAKAVFSPIADVFVTPVVNPSSDPKQACFNHQNIDLRQMMAEENSPSSLSAEAQTLCRWISFTKPKAVLSLGLGTPGINTEGVPPSVAQRLADLTEKTLVNGEAKEDKGSAVAGLRAWCVNQGFIWIELVVDDSKKTFDEIREGDWKKSIGPALKWLLEGERFNPPKEEALSLDHLIVPALEMPPEFAHLM